MNRRDFLSLAGMLSFSTLLPDCGRIAAPLRIASHTWPGYEFMFLAQREGWLSSLDSILVETGSATESIQLLATGQADGAALTLDEVLKVRDQGIPLTVVLVFDISMSADVLLAKPEIETLQQLKGKRIGFEQSAVGELLLYKALEAAGLRYTDIHTVTATFDRHLMVWRDDNVDALITYEPVSSQLEAEGARRLFDSSKIPDTIFDVLAVTPTALDRYQDALEKLVAAHFQGLENFRKNPYDTTYRMAEHLKASPKEVVSAFKGLELPDEKRSFTLLNGENSKIVMAAQNLGAIMAQAGILKNGPGTFANLTSVDFIDVDKYR